jgi:hypothetical protein
VSSFRYGASVPNHIFTHARTRLLYLTAFQPKARSQRDAARREDGLQGCWQGFGATLCILTIATDAERAQGSEGRAKQAHLLGDSSPFHPVVPD